MTVPDHFTLGPLIIYYYSLCLLAAVWVGYWVLVRLAKRAKVSETVVTDATMLVLVSGVIGARFFYVVQNLDYYSAQPGDIWRLTTGGLSIHGALLVGALALYWFSQHRSVSFLKLTDLFSLPLLAGQIIGRLGNYFNQELFGYPTNLPWRIFIEADHRPTIYKLSSHFHPVFLYEMALLLVGFLVLSRLRFQRPGQLTGAYLIVLGVARFLTEIWRISERLLWQLSLAQLVSLVLVGLGVWLARKGRFSFTGSFSSIS